MISKRVHQVSRQKFTLQYRRENFKDLDQLKPLDDALPFKWLSENFRRVACKFLAQLARAFRTRANQTATREISNVS